MRSLAVRLLLAVLGLLAVQLVPENGQAMTIQIAGGGTNFIQAGDTWRYFKGTAAPSNPADAWNKLSFVDAAWLSGPTGIGYGDGDDATVLSDMAGGYRTVYARREFTVASMPVGETLELVIDYDDGFIAYVNGDEVARRHMPAGAATYQTDATSHEAGTPEVIPLGSAADLLQAGANVLAIEGHNAGIDSGDFSLIPALRTGSSMVKDGDTWIVDAATVPLSGSTSAATATSVKIAGEAATFNPADRTWQGTAALSPGLNTVVVEAFDAAMTVVDNGTIKILHVPASNHASGTLAESATWSGACVVDANLTVPAGVTLTIQAGTVVMFKPAVSMTVQGQLIADGTEEAPSRFTHYGDGSRWKQILFAKAADSRLSHCTVEFADSAGDHQDYYLPGPRNYHEAVVLLATHVDFEGCTFQKLPDASAGGEGDALAIMSDDENYVGKSSATFKSCKFLGIGQGIHTRFSHVLVEDCYFQNKHGDNDDIDLWGESDPPCIIRHNMFDLPEYDDRINPTRCSAIIIGNTIMGSNDHGMVLRDKGSPIVMNNLILNCSAGGIAVENSNTALLVNNTIVGCGRGLRLFDLGRWDSPYFLNPGGGTATVINCVIRDCNEVITLADSSNTTIADKGSHITVMNSNIEGGRAAVSVSGSQSTVTWGTGNIDADPLFENPGANNYRLKPGSPSIDSGTADQAPPSDQDGHPRPCGAGVDMGAYEYCESLPQLFQRGDANADGQMDISDAVTILLYLFVGGVTPPCIKSADTNDNGDVVISDPIYLLRYLFLADPAPPAPLGECGPDTVADELACESFPPCP